MTDLKPGWTDPTSGDNYSILGGFQEKRTLNEERGEWEEEVVDWSVPVLFVLSDGLEADGENYPQIPILPILKDALSSYSNPRGGLDPRAYEGLLKFIQDLEGVLAEYTPDPKVMG